MLTGSEAKNGISCTSNKRERDAVVLLVLWVRYLETFLSQRFNLTDQGH